MATFQRQTIQPVATCRQTVEASLATPPPLGSRSLPFGLERDQTIFGGIRLESIERN
jgi:hypothetical protein